MPDELDMMLEGQDQETPSGSQPGTENTGSNPDNPIEGAGGQAEKDEWEKLSGNAQDRFRFLYREKQRAIEEAQRYKQLMLNGQSMQQQQTGQLTPETKEAIQKLKNVGIATMDDVDSKIQQILAQKTYSDELSRLETKLSGNDGKPKFTREEYFDYVERYPQYKNYLPEDVYEKMFRDELDDWRTTHKGTNPERRSQGLKPTRSSVNQNELTVEEIEEKLKSLPDGQRAEWYAANQKKINEAVARMRG